MELERHLIERKDFAAARRGYDPDEVDRHLREIADAVGDLRRAASGSPAADVGSVARAAADQVRAIVEAAERSAAEISEQAERDARAARSEAEQDARETRERADADAAEHVRKVEEATAGMLERSRSIQSEIDGLLSGLREATTGLAESVRTTAETLASEVREAGTSLSRTVEASAESLSSDLESIRTGLGDVRGARGPEIAAPSVAEAPAAFEPDEPPVVEAVQPTSISAVPEAGEEEPAPVYEEEEEHFASEVPEEEELEGDRAVAPEEPEPEPEPGRTVAGGEGARLIALNMALNGTPREETARYLAENFELADQDAILDDVYSRAGQS